MKRTKHSNLPTINSVSGGKSSAYVAANYPAEYCVFALVRIEDEDCRFPDEKLRKKVEDRIQAPFIATAEDDDIIYTMLDLEQYIGQKIHWVTGPTFDELLKKKGGYFPNKIQRFCTQNLKIYPIFEWLYKHNLTPCEQRFGFRAREGQRIIKQQERCNKRGFVDIKYSFEKHTTGPHKGKNKWETFDFYKPSYPLFDDRITRRDVNKFWKDKPVRFAELNNCQGCFFRNPALLNTIYHKGKESNKNVIEWYRKQEEKYNDVWRSETTYKKIIETNFSPLVDLELSDFNDCDSGYCGL